MAMRRVAAERQVHVRRDDRRAARRRQLDAVERLPLGAGLVERGRAHDDGAATGGDGVDARLVGHRLELAVGRPPPHVENGGVVDRVGEEHDARAVEASPTARTCRSVGVTGSPSTSRRRAPSRSAHATRRRRAEPGRRARARPTGRPCPRSAASCRPGGRIDLEHLDHPLVAPLHRDDQAGRSSGRRRGTGSGRGPTRRRRLAPSRATRCSVTSALGVPAAG